MAGNTVQALPFPFSSVFQQHILDACLGREIEHVNKIIDQALAEEAKPEMDVPRG